MSRNDKVVCQCCGKSMVPRVIVTRGVLGWPIRIGEGVTHSVCPFCLSEHWKTGETPTALQRFFKSAPAWYGLFIFWSIVIIAITGGLLKVMGLVPSDGLLAALLVLSLILAIILVQISRSILGGTSVKK